MKSATLQTERLLLRSYSPADRQAFIDLVCDPIVREKMDGPHTLDSAIELFQRITSEEDDLSLSWAVEEKTSETYVGHVFVTRETAAADPELGYLFFQPYWGRGFATEVVKRVLDFCSTEQGWRRFVATVDCDHPASIRVLEKNGFVRKETKCDDDDPTTPYFVYATRIRE